VAAGLEGPAEELPADVSNGRIFDSVLPTYLLIGMTPEEFWEGDPWLAAAYRERERLRQERLNAEQWRLGAYVYEAILRCAPVLTFHTEETSPEPWRERPFGMEETLESKESKRQEEARVANSQVAAALMNFAHQFEER